MMSPDGGRKVSWKPMAARGLPDHQLVPLAVHHQGGVRQDLVGNELPADQGLHGVLEEAAQRPGAVEGVVPVVDDVGLGSGGEFHLQLLVGQAAVQAAQEKVHDGGDVLLGEGLVVDDLVQPVEELRPEGALEQLVHLVPGTFKTT